MQWTYYAYLAAVKEQDGAAMSMGRIDAFLDTYFEKDLKAGRITEEAVQELIDQFVMKMRIVRCVSCLCNSLHVVRLAVRLSVVLFAHGWYQQSLCVALLEPSTNNSLLLVLSAPAGSCARLSTTTCLQVTRPG